MCEEDYTKEELEIIERKLKRTLETSEGDRIMSPTFGSKFVFEEEDESHI